MPRYLIPKTFTIRPDQHEFLQAIGPGGEVSRWIREAIDEKISVDSPSKIGADGKIRVGRSRARRLKAVPHTRAPVEK